MKATPKCLLYIQVSNLCFLVIFKFDLHYSQQKKDRGAQNRWRSTTTTSHRGWRDGISGGSSSDPATPQDTGAYIRGKLFKWMACISILFLVFSNGHPFILETTCHADFFSCSSRLQFFVIGCCCFQISIYFKVTQFEHFGWDLHTIVKKIM